MIALLAQVWMLWGDRRLDSGPVFRGFTAAGVCISNCVPWLS